MWEYNVDAGNNVAEIIVRNEMALPINYPQTAQGLSENKINFPLFIDYQRKSCISSPGHPGVSPEPTAGAAPGRWPECRPPINSWL